MASDESASPKPAYVSEALLWLSGPLFALSGTRNSRLLRQGTRRLCLSDDPDGWLSAHLVYGGGALGTLIWSFVVSALVFRVAPVIAYAQAFLLPLLLVMFLYHFVSTVPLRFERPGPRYWILRPGLRADKIFAVVGAAAGLLLLLARLFNWVHGLLGN